MSVSVRLLVCLSTLLAAPVHAADAPPVFSRHDLDRDGYIDRREYYQLRQRLRRWQGPQHRAARMREFEQLDLDADGRVGHDELLKGLHMRPRQGGGRGGRQGGPGSAPPAGP